MSDIIEEMAEQSKLSAKSKKYINTYIAEDAKNNIIIKNDTDIEVIINEPHIIIIPPEKIEGIKEGKNIWTFKDINLNNSVKIMILLILGAEFSRRACRHETVQEKRL